MDWVTAIWSVMAGACLMLALMHLVIWCLDRSLSANFWFCVAVLGVVGLMACEMVTMHARTPEVYVAGIRYAHLIHLMGVVGMAGFVHCHFGTGSRRLLWLALALRVAAVVANFTTGQSLHIARLESLSYMDFFGQTVSILGKWEPNRWVLLAQAASLVLVIYIADASWRLWRKGTRDARVRAATIGGGLVFFIIAGTAQAGLVAAGVVKMPFFVSLPFLGMVVVMGGELSRDLLRAARLSRDLTASKERLRQAAGAARMALWEWNIDSDRIWISEEGGKFYGTEPYEEIGMARFVGTLHPHDRETVERAIEKAKAGPDPYAVEYRVVLPDGGVSWIAAEGRVERDGKGRATVLRGVSLDITARRQAEERFRLVIEAAPNAMVMIDAAGRIVLVNTQTERVFGYSREELLGGLIELLIPERFRGPHPGLRGNYQELPTARTMGAGRELFGRRKDGSEVAVEIGLNPIEMPEGRFVLASIIDITGRKQAEREAARQQQELAHLSRISILGELAGALAHELNQPLAAILGNAQVGRGSLRTGPPDLTEMAAILDDIADDAKRAGGIIHGMRAMFKKDSVSEPVPMDLNETVNQVLHLLHSEVLGRKVTLETRLAADLPAVSAGRVEIQQVLINLVMNGLDAMRAQKEGGHLEITSARVADRIEVTVHDSGPGIAEDVVERLFEPFFSTKHGGLGLGLAISRSIAVRFKGELAAENHPDGGAVFVLSLPVAVPGD